MNNTINNTIKNTMKNTTIINEFQTTKNKSTLWGFMIENKVFEGIDNKYSNEIKQFFEKKIIQIASNISALDTLVILNKQVISEMMTHISNFKEANNTARPELISASDITDHRQKVFNKVLEKKQSEFNSLINKNVPDKIDFSDNADKPIGSDMERMIAETIAWRQKELNVVLQSQDQSEASKWINRDQPAQNGQNGQNAQNGQNGQNASKPKFIKIGETTALDTQSIIDVKKKVSFNLEQNTEEDDPFLSMLKQKPINDAQDIKSMLKEIINNQKKILDLITNMQKN